MIRGKKGCLYPLFLPFVVFDRISQVGRSKTDESTGIFVKSRPITKTVRNTASCTRISKRTKGDKFHHGVLKSVRNLAAMRTQTTTDLGSNAYPNRNSQIAIRNTNKGW